VLVLLLSLVSFYAQQGKDALIEHLPEIAKEYQSHEFSYKDEYTMDLLWEGEQYDIPLTLYIFVWPPGSKPTTIHSHPFFCAYTPIKGELIQLTYDKDIKLLKKETILPGQLIIDDNSEPFIHQNGSTTGAVSLHAYGAKNDREVMNQFNAHTELQYPTKTLQAQSPSAPHPQK